MRAIGGAVSAGGSVDPGSVALLEHASVGRGGVDILRPAALPTAVVDWRLDDRPGLCDQLGIHPDSADTDVAVAAFRRWGSRFPRYLEGDFAVAIWDPATASVVLARDHVGARPLCYARTGSMVAFASSPVALVGLPGVPPVPDEVAIAQYLAEWELDRSITFFERVSRVPAGHVFIAEPGGRAQMREYWHLPQTELKLASDEEYEEALRERFDRAVRVRLATKGTTVCELTGGLDSSVVTATAVRHVGDPSLVRAYSIGFDAPWDEGDFRRPLIDALGIDARTIPAQELDGPDLLDDMVATLGSPRIGPFYLLHHALYRGIAADVGPSVVLDGLDGDTVLGSGILRPLELVRRGHPVRGVQEALSLRGPMHLAWRTIFAEAGWRPVYGWARRHLLGNERPPDEGILATRLVRARGLRRSFATAPTWRLGDAADRRRAEMTSGFLTQVLESRHASATAAGLEVSHPFLDRRVMEFCAVLPSEQLLRDGWTRSLQRRAFGGRITDSITFRTRKGVIPPDLTATMLGRDRVEALLREDGGRAQPYIRPDSLPRLRQRWLEGDHDASFAVMQVVSIDSWLRWLDRRESG